MAKVTSKLQVTVPKALADRYGIAPGDEIAWEAGGDAIRVVPRPKASAARTTKQRQARFDQATERQRARERGMVSEPAADRGWQREELYDRARTR